MSLALRVGKDTAIYGLAMVVQRGMAFFLLPLYTHFLAPNDFGILSVVTAINGALAVLFTLSLNGAVTRYYFEYCESPETLARFIGTIFTFIALLSGLAGGILLFVGEVLLAPILGDVPFWPFAALGVLATVFQPTVQIYLSLLQAKGRSLEFALISLLQFSVNIALVVVFVVLLDMRAEGALVASLVVAVVFYCITMYRMRGALRIGVDRDHLTAALRYSLPIVPHAASGQLQAAADRILLNGLIGSSAAGIYQVSYLIAGLVGVVGYSMNLAYMPVAMSAMKSPGGAQLAELRDVGLGVIIICLSAASAIALMGHEIVWLLTSREYLGAAAAIPVGAFAFAAGGIYYVFVNVLFFDVRATRYIFIGTASGAVANVCLNLALIPKFGVMGAALALLASHVATTVIVALIGARYEYVRWPYARIALGLLSCACMVAMALSLTEGISWQWALGGKVALLVAIYTWLNILFWGRAHYLAASLTRTIADRTNAK